MTGLYEYSSGLLDSVQTDNLNCIMELVLSRVLVTCRRGLDWWVDLLDTHKS
jgi:hypothetical protein